MIKLLTAFAFAMFGIYTCVAGPTQSLLPTPEPINGHFYVDIAGNAQIYVNGPFTARPFGAGSTLFTSDPATIKAGDRVMIKLTSASKGGFRFAFRSIDGTRQIDFKRWHVKILPPEKQPMDFDPAEFTNLKQAKEGKKSTEVDLGFPANPDYVWAGERESYLAILITKDMFKTPQPSNGYGRTEIWNKDRR